MRAPNRAIIIGVLRLSFTVADLARLRFAFSALWEVVASVRVLKDPAAHALHLPWTRAAAARLTTEPELLFALVPVPTVLLPGFLAPTPSTPLPSLDDELARLVATDPDTCRADLDDTIGTASPVVRRLWDDPAAGLTALADDVRAYHDAVLAPDWPRVLACLEGDVTYRARRLARGGPELLFADLDPAVSWSGDTLTIAVRSVDEDRALGDRGLVLVPSAFVWPRVFAKTARPSDPVIRYPARGIAGLWSGSIAAPAALAGIVGRGRAAVLAALGEPSTTSELARRVSLAPATVSEHVAKLRAAGLVTSTRAGAVVVHTRTAVADQLVRGDQS